jgi:hypothetical protein
VELSPTSHQHEEVAVSERSNVITKWARWLATFVGFPAAGVVARACIGGVDDITAAVVAGLASGAVLGAIQAIVGGLPAQHRLRWVFASACGFSLGLAAGAVLVGYRTDAASLVVMGAVCGAAVGAAQAFSMPMAVRDRLAWAVATPLLWAGGWWITAQVIVDADRQHAVFGSSGALFVSAISGILVAARQPVGRMVEATAPAARVAGVS